MTTKKRNRRRGAATTTTTSDHEAERQAWQDLATVRQHLLDALTADGRVGVVKFDHGGIEVIDTAEHLKDTVASLWRAIGAMIRVGAMTAPNVTSRAVTTEELQRLRG